MQVQNMFFQEATLKLSLTEGGREGKSKLVASNRYLESECCGMCEEEGTGISDSVDDLGLEIRNQTKMLGKKKGETEEGVCRDLPSSRKKGIEKGVQENSYQHSVPHGSGARKRERF